MTMNEKHMHNNKYRECPLQRRDRLKFYCKDVCALQDPETGECSIYLAMMEIAKRPPETAADE